MIQTKCARFTKIRPHQMQTVLCKQEMQISNFKWLLFPNRLSVFYFKINKVEAIDEMDRLCNFHENPTKKIDVIAKARKRLTDGRKQIHDISSAGFQPVMLKTL